MCWMQESRYSQILVSYRAVIEESARVHVPRLRFKRPCSHIEGAQVRLRRLASTRGARQ